MFSFSTRFFTTQYNIYHYCIWPAHKSKSEFLRFDNDGRHSVYSRCLSTRKKCGDVAMLYILPEIHKSKLSKYYSNCRIIFFPVDTFHCNIGRTSFFCSENENKCRKVENVFHLWETDWQTKLFGAVF